MQKSKIYIVTRMPAPKKRGSLRRPNPTCSRQPFMSDEEQQFNKNKLEKKHIDAHLKGLMLPDETDYHLRTATYAEVERRHKAFTTRLRASRKYTDSIHQTTPTIQHHNVFVLDRCWTEDLRAKLVANHCRRVTDEIDATVHSWTP